MRMCVYAAVVHRAKQEKEKETNRQKTETNKIFVYYRRERES